MKTKLSRPKKTLIRPYTYISDSIGADSLKMCILLALQIVMLFVTKSYHAIFVILSSLSASILAEFIDRQFQNTIGDKDSFSLRISIVQGLITGFLLPENYPVLTVFFVTLFTMLVIKYMFGGYARAWVNPCIASVAILWVIGSRLFPDFLVTYDVLMMRNPSQILIESGSFPLIRFDTSITDALNNSVFRLFKVSIPEGYVSLFWDTGSSIPAFRFNLLTLISSIVLFGDNYVKSLIAFSFCAFYFTLVRFLSPFFFQSGQIFGDVLLAFLTSGTLFFATFIVGWYGTAPGTLAGKLIYGSIAGISAFFIAGPGTSPVGMVFTVFVSNVASIVIRQFEARNDRIRTEKLLVKREGAVNAD